jgi:hypothetical protein
LLRRNILNNKKGNFINAFKVVKKGYASRQEEVR